MGMTERFVDALHHLDTTGDAAPLSGLFAGQATLQRMAQHRVYRGQDATRRFWHEYRSAFRDVDTRFHRTAATDGLVLLEWTSRGTLANGEPFQYDGVSIVENDGEHVTAFRTYYDSASLLHPTVKPT